MEIGNVKEVEGVLNTGAKGFTNEALGLLEAKVEEAAQLSGAVKEANFIRASKVSSEELDWFIGDDTGGDIGIGTGDRGRGLESAGELAGML